MAVVKAHPATNQPVAKAGEGKVALAQRKLTQLEKKTLAVAAVEHIPVAIPPSLLTTQVLVVLVLS